MQNISVRPIPVDDFLSSKKAISLDGNYIACTTHSKHKTRTSVMIINLIKKFYINKNEEPYFQHSFNVSKYNLFKKNKAIKIHDIAFNKDSNKLYCLTETQETTEFYQFDFINCQKSSNYKKIVLSFRAQCFATDEITDYIKYAGFKNNKITHGTLKLNTTQVKETSSNVTEANVTKLSFNKDNMHLYALLENNRLEIFTENQECWTITYSINNCPSIPICYSNNENDLVFKKDSTIKIITKISNKNKENIFEADFKYPIKDVCINSSGTKAVVFRSGYDDFENTEQCYYDVLMRSNYNWDIIYTNTFKIYTAGYVYSKEHKYKNILSLFNNKDELITLFRAKDITYSSSKNKPTIEYELLDLQKKQLLYNERKNQESKDRDLAKKK